MSTTAYEQPEHVAEVVVREPIEKARPTWIGRVRSADHKVIGTTLIGISLISVVVAGFLELLGWAQLSVPDNTLLTPERYYTLHTLSDTSYLYLFALPLLAGLATYVLPLQIGARSTAFPRLSAFGAWSIAFGAGALFFQLFLTQWQGGVNFNTSLAQLYYSTGAGADLWLSGVIMIGAGLTANAIDLAVTYKVMRADGMSSENTPVFAYTAAVYAYGILLTAPVLIAASLMMMLERQWDVFGIYNTVTGGDALLGKTLFGWWNNSAPYLVTLLAAGAVSEIIPVAAGTKLANAGAVKKALKFFMIFSVLSFGTVYFGGPVALGWNCVFMTLGLALLVPASVLVSSWIQTLRQGSFKSSAQGHFALRFVLFFTLAMALHAALSIPTLGAWLRGSEAGYAAWHLLVWAAAATGGFGALLYWFPKITGKLFNDFKAKVACGMITIGTLIALLSMISLGLDGFPREISEYSDSLGGQARFIEAGLGTLLAAFGVIGLLINFIQSSASGSGAGNDPWHGHTLEWYAPSPPPVNNFDVTPAVDSDTPLLDIRSRIKSETGGLAGSVAQSPTSGRPSLRESKH